MIFNLCLGFEVVSRSNLLPRERLHADDVLLREVRSRGGAPVDFVDFRPWLHGDRVLYRADCVAYRAPCAVLLNDLGNGVVTIEGDRLIARIRAGKETAPALETLVLVNHWGEKLLPVHLFKGGDVLQLRT